MHFSSKKDVIRARASKNKIVYIFRDSEQTVFSILLITNMSKFFVFRMLMVTTYIFASSLIQRIGKIKPIFFYFTERSSTYSLSRVHLSQVSDIGHNVSEIDHCAYFKYIQKISLPLRICLYIHFSAELDECSTLFYLHWHHISALLWKMN